MKLDIERVTDEELRINCNLFDLNETGRQTRKLRNGQITNI